MPALLLALAILACESNGEARQAELPGAGLPVPAFNEQNAFAHIATQVAFGPRVPGTSPHQAQLDWMTDFLTARADTVILQPFTHVTLEHVHLELTNVFARFRPDVRDRILLLAHWDTRPTADQDPDHARRAEPFPGANDGASGVAVLLELADVLSRHSPPIGVDLLFTDGEDYGPTARDMLLGATHFAANLPPGYRPMYGILLDMIADRQPEYRIEGHSQRYAPEVVDRVWRLAAELGYGSAFTRRSWGPIDDDHLPLNRAGIRTINIIDFDYGPGNRYWHTHQDDLANVSADGPGMVGRVLTALIFRGG